MPDAAVLERAPEGTARYAPPVGRVNVPEEQLLANIQYNIRRQLPQFSGGREVPDHIAVVGGGWSLNETFDELRALHFDGVKIVALNGAANWLMERNIRPSMFVMLDARDDEGNRAFVREPIPRCRYMMASQVAPSVIDLCRDRDVMLFHAMGDGGEPMRDELDSYYAKRWNTVPSAGCVGIVAICLLRLAGYRFQHLFGLDSCNKDGAHHAYPQSLNDADPVGRFWCAGREFHCTPWQAKQSATFLDLIKTQGQHLSLEVYGNGLLAHMVRTGATLMKGD